MVLAQKLKLITIEKGKLTHELSNKKDEISNLIKENAVLRDLLDKTKQPYCYLIKRIEELELELIKARENIKNKDNNLKRYANENELQEQKIENLSSDLKSVLVNRAKLENIEEMMLRVSKLNYNENKEDSVQKIIDNNGNRVNLQNSIPIIINNSTQIDNQQDNNKMLSESVPNWYKTYKTLGKKK